LHGATLVGLLFIDGGLDLSLLKVFTLSALVINSLVWISGMKKPLHSLYLFLFPISAISLAAAVMSLNSTPGFAGVVQYTGSYPNIHSGL
jgi:ABC-type uncharacterized transport system permease subunit